MSPLISQMRKLSPTEVVMSLPKALQLRGWVGTDVLTAPSPARLPLLGGGVGRPDRQTGLPEVPGSLLSTPPAKVELWWAGGAGGKCAHLCPDGTGAWTAGR